MSKQGIEFGQACDGKFAGLWRNRDTVRSQAVQERVEITHDGAGRYVCVGNASEHGALGIGEGESSHVGSFKCWARSRAVTREDSKRGGFSITGQGNWGQSALKRKQPSCRPNASLRGALVRTEPW